MPRFAPRLLVLLMASAALSACSMLGGPDVKEKLGVIDKPAAPRNVASDVDGNLRQAQLLRLAGKYDEAILILSQLTLFAADNPRVVAEYGKALAQKGRAQDATQFLRRALELSPNDWTIYSALGVAYDQTSDHVNARAAYERALSLRPGEASVLNNFALSRMLAKDPEGARMLIAQAQSAGEPGNEKIARNVALINQMSPAAVAAAPKPVQTAAVARPPIPVLEAPVARNALQDAEQVARRIAADGAPRALTPAPEFAAAPPDLEQTALAVAEQTAPPPDRTVVMQAVPFDPLAGPVKPRPRPRAAAVKKAAPVQQAQVPSLRVASEQY